METNTFKMWFFKFCEIVTDGPLLLMFDGHLTHIPAPVIKKALEQNIIILKFPLHVTDMLQPLDVACFGPLNREFERHLHKCISKYGIKQPLTKSEFVNELCAIWNTGMKRDSIISGFEATGTVLKTFDIISLLYFNILVKMKKKSVFSYIYFRFKEPHDIKRLEN